MTVELKKERIKNWLEGKKEPPWEIQIHPTNRCNLNCKFCWRTGSDKRGFKELSREKWLSIIKEACEMKVKRLIFSGGGEPTLRPRIIEQSSKIMEDYDVESALVTNGVFLSKKLLEEMVERGWSSVTFSITGSNADVDDFLRGRKGAFEKTVENVDRLTKLRGNKRYPKITFQTVITKYNYDELLYIYHLARHFKADVVQFKMVNEGRTDPSKEDMSIEKGMLKKIESQLDKINRIENNLFKEDSILVKTDFSLKNLKGSFEIEELNNKNKIKNLKCVKPFSELVILSDGSTHPCCVVAESQYHEDVEKQPGYIESIKDKSLREIWMGNAFNGMRSIIQDGRIPEECKKLCPIDCKYRRASGLNSKNIPV